MPISKFEDSELQRIRELVAKNAASQGGVFRRIDLIRWGFQPELAPLMVRRRLWVRLLHGIYADSAVLDACSSEPRARHTLDCAAAVLAYREDVHVHSLSAAYMYELPIADRFIPQVIHLARTSGREVRRRNRVSGSRLSVPGLKVSSHSVSVRDRTVLDGIPVVSKALAAFSASAHHDHERAVAIMDAVAFKNSDVLADYQRFLKEWNTISGIALLRHATAEVRSGAQSPLESISRVRLMKFGLPEPKLQYEVRDHSGLVGYADMYWSDLGVIGEADGLNKYQSRDDLIAEKSREDRLRALGFAVVRWTWDEIVAEPRAIVRRILDASRHSLKRAV